MSKSFAERLSEDLGKAQKPEFDQAYTELRSIADGIHEAVSKGKSGLEVKLEPGYTILHMGAARDDDDGGPLFKGEAMHERQPVFVRQAEIDKADIRHRGLEHGLEFRGAAKAHGAKARILERIGEHRADFRFVIENGY